MIDAQLRFTKPVYKRLLAVGVMFDDVLSVHVDPDGGKSPFLAQARDSWGRGVSRRYETLEEAKGNLDRLHRVLNGYAR